jgi:nuclear distribution protein NudE
VSSLLDVEIKFNRAIEEKTLLEQEVIQRNEVEEECQRLKDDVRGESYFALLE